MPARDDELTIRTTSGAVRGRREQGLLVWRGVPFAAAPVGPRRFRAPVPPDPWSGVRDATEPGAAPPQPRTTRRAGVGRGTQVSEDSLTVSVVRRAEASGPRPVMVFSHGRGYGVGSADAGAYWGDRLAARGDVVFVSFNYRLGALGWMDFSSWSTPARPIEPNPGLRDHVAALEWVRDNAAAFGGDPENVTLFGESAGGTSVATLLTMPAARGLITRAIVQSGAVSTAVAHDRAERWATRLLGLLDIDPVGPGVPAALEGAPASQLVRAVRHLELLLAEEEPGRRPLAPVVDGELLPRHPLDVFRDGGSHPVPLIIGTNRDEGTLFQRVLRTIAATPDRIDRLFEQTNPHVRDEVLAAYPAYPHRDTMADLVRDLIFWQPSTAVASGHAAVAPTRMYRFDFAPRILALSGLGATHAAELDFVFGSDDSLVQRIDRLLQNGRAARAVIRHTQTRWLSFAQSGDPGRDWPGYDATSRRTLVIDVEDRIERDPRVAARVALDDWASR